MEIKILKEGIHECSKVDDERIIDVCDPICSSVVLIKGKKNIIVDAGNLGFEEEILKDLKKEGLKPEDIDYVLITHKHPDHFLGAYIFKNASIVFNKSVLKRKKGTYYKDADFIDISEIQRIKTPGHTPDHLSVVVKTDKTCVIAGDAIRYDMLEKGFANEKEKESAKKILEIADIIIPGHGPVIKGKKLDEFKKLFK